MEKQRGAEKTKKGFKGGRSMKDIKKILSEQSRDVLPDNDVKEKVKRELGFDRQVSRSAAYATGGESAQGGRKTYLMTLAVVVAVIAVFLAVFLPIFFKKGASGGLTDKFAEITDADSFYAYGAASVGSLLDSTDAAPQSLGAVVPVSAVAMSESRDDRIDFVNKYMTLIEGLVGDGKLSQTAIGGDDEFEFGMKVTFVDMLGDSTSYNLFYNKIFRDGEIDGDETEENYSIEGVLVVGENRYPVQGTYEIETEENEEESELSFTAFVDRDARSFIKVEQEEESETEDGESEVEKKYVYTVVANGEVVEKTSVDYESEEGELELRLTVEKNGREDVLLFTGETEDGKQVISVRGELDGKKVRFKIYVREGNYHYVFDDGTSSDHNRPSHYDDDDD